MTNQCFIATILKLKQIYKRERSSILNVCLKNKKEKPKQDHKFYHFNTLETKKEKYQAIKQGMMQELLTGKTRLV